MSEMSAYEKMLEDGTAFKKIDMTQSMEPDLKEAAGGNNGLGEEINSLQEKNPKQENEREDDFSEFDNYMDQRIQSLRSKMKGEGKQIKSVGKIMTPTRREIETLKKRISRLEEALTLVMETHEQLLGE